MNSRFPPREVVEHLRQQYPVGCRVELVAMDDPYSRLCPGNQCIVRCVDDAGAVFVSWDCGSGLGVVYGVDAIKRL